MKKLLILIIVLVASTASGAVYHIDPTVGSSGSGTAASPFKSWTNLPSMSTGDDVYFKCGTTFTPSSPLSVSWQGTSSDPATIGAYYLNGSTPVYAVNGNKPIISGNNYSVPSLVYTGMINFYNKDYVVIQDLKISKVGGRGISISGDYDVPVVSTYPIIRNVDIENTYGQAIVVEKNTECGGIIENCEISYNGYGYILDMTTNWQSAVSITRCPRSGIVIRNNFVHHSWGEGISSFRDSKSSINEESGFITIENNIVFCCASTGIYIQASDGCVVRNNLVLGAAESSLGGNFSGGGFGRAVGDGRLWSPSGISISSEYLSDIPSKNNKVYNNLIAGHYSGLSHSCSIPGESDGNQFYNNTMIGNRYNFIFRDNLNTDDRSIVNTVVKNNISYCPSDTICQDIYNDYSFLGTKITWDYNSWETSKSNVDGTHDVMTNDYFAKTSGWQELTGIIDADNFTLMAGNTSIDAGADLSSLFTDDYFGDTRSTPWDIGAQKYGGISSPTPSTYVSQGVTTPPTIDGSLSDWSAVDSYITLTDTISGAVGSYRISWDDTALYIAGSVVDTKLNSTHTTRDSDVWLDDSFEIVLGSVLSTENNLSATTDHKVNINIAEYSLDGKGTGTGTGWDLSWNPTLTAAVINTGTLNDASADTGYVFEAKILWSDLGASAPSDNDVWQFDLQQNDIDDDAVRTTSAWVNSDGGNFNNPLGWGRLSFSAAPVTPTCDTQSVYISQETQDTDVSLWSAARGQSFTSNGKSIYSISLYFSTADSASIEMRFGESSDLTTYIATKTDSVSLAGWHEFVFDTPIETTENTVYYLGVVKSEGAANIRKDEGGTYSEGTWRYATSGWNLSGVSSTQDATFKVKVCDTLTPNLQQSQSKQSSIFLIK